MVVVCQERLVGLEVLLLEMGEQRVWLRGVDLGGLLGGLGEGEGAVVVGVFVDLALLVSLRCAYCGQ